MAGNKSQKRDEQSDFYIHLKNARSLQSDERLEELLAELEMTQWDVVLLNETWRGANEEFDTLESGHLWLGSGGTAGKHGVGILLHRRWSHQVKSWHASSTRLGVLELDLGRLKLTLVVTYMPHAGKSDAEVEKVYSSMSTVLKQARSSKRLV
eukprot:7562530-Karenia_brevis.AAC.1